MAKHQADTPRESRADAVELARAEWLAAQPYNQDGADMLALEPVAALLLEVALRRAQVHAHDVQPREHARGAHRALQRAFTLAQFGAAGFAFGGVGGRVEAFGIGRRRLARTLGGQRRQRERSRAQQLGGAVGAWAPNVSRGHAGFLGNWLVN